MVRTIHLIDIENLAADGIDRHDIALDRLDQHLDKFWNEDDLVIVSGNRKICTKLAWDIPVSHSMKIAHSDEDGTHFELLDAANESNLERFDRLAIASGDGMFTELAMSVAGSGTEVVVSANAGSLSWSLRAVADRVSILPN